MVVGIGIDLVDVSRVERAVGRYGTRFLDRVFTPREQVVYQRGRSCERLAARFAAKEAVMKALGTGRSRGVGWRDIEVVGESGPPRVHLRGKALDVARGLGIQTIYISLTHEGDSAAAVAVAQTGAGVG